MDRKGRAQQRGIKAKEVIDILTSAGMTINLTKSVLSASELTFLGFRMSGSGISPDAALVKTNLDVQLPKNRNQLEIFLGLANFFGRFIPRYSDLTEPLNELQNKNANFSWGPRQTDAFGNINTVLCKGPMIQPFDKNKETTLTTDASEKAVAAVLLQQGHPVMYFSRNFDKARYSNVEKEALTIV